MDAYKERIRPLFDSTGKTDKELEVALGLPRGVIYKWGTGKYKSYKAYLTQIASYFHVSADYLLGNTDDPRLPEDISAEKEKSPATNEGDKALEEFQVLFNQLSPEQKERELAYLRSLLAAANK